MCSGLKMSNSDSSDKPAPLQNAARDNMSDANHHKHIQADNEFLM